MPAKKSSKKATKAKATTKQPVTKAEFEKAGYTQTKSGRWVKDIAAYNKKVRDGLIDPDTGLRTGKKGAAKKATAKKAKKVNGRVKRVKNQPDQIQATA